MCKSNIALAGKINSKDGVLEANGVVYKEFKLSEKGMLHPSTVVEEKSLKGEGVVEYKPRPMEPADIELVRTGVEIAKTRLETIVVRG